MIRLIIQNSWLSSRRAWLLSRIWARKTYWSGLGVNDPIELESFKLMQNLLLFFDLLIDLLLCQSFCSNIWNGITTCLFDSFLLLSSMGHKVHNCTRNRCVGTVWRWITLLISRLSLMIFSWCWSRLYCLTHSFLLLSLLLFLHLVLHISNKSPPTSFCVALTELFDLFLNNLLCFPQLLLRQNLGDI